MLEMRGLRRWGAVAAVLLGISMQSAGASAPTPEEGAQFVQERKTTAYRDVLEAFDGALESRPDDAALAVERCRFIGQFTDDEYGDWVESAPDDFEQCTETLQSRWSHAPEAQLYSVEQLWGEDAIEAGSKLVEASRRWPRALRARLLAELSEAHEFEDEDRRAGELAVEAAQLGEGTRVPLAVRHLASRRKFADADRLLAATPPARDQWNARERVEAALELPNARIALRELQRHASDEWEIDAAVAARAYLRAGEVATARRLLAGDKRQTRPLAAVRFDAALAAGDHVAAAALVQLGDTDAFGDNLERFARLATQAPATLLSGSMLVAMFICLAVLAGIALLPALLIVPVHYRGLVRRVRGRVPVPLFDGAGIRHAWWALAAFLCVPVIVGLLVEPAAMVVLLTGEVPPPAGELARMTAWGTVIGLLALVPALRGFRARELLGDRESLRASWRVLVAWALLFGVGMLLVLARGAAGVDPAGGETLQTKTVNTLVEGGVAVYGPLATLLLMAVLTPVFEELVFRGLLLGGLARHISFGWANTLQAALFAVVHDDPPRLPFYFAMGLLAGWLVRRTRALGPAVALHALNNALAVGLKLL